MASPAPASRPDPLPAPDDVPPLPDAPRSAAAPTTTWGAVDDVTAPSFVGPGPVEPSVEPAYDPAAGSTGTAPAAPISGRRAAER